MAVSIKRSVDLSSKTYEALQQIAAAQHKPVSELIRKYINDGMNVDRASADIDFIRKQIREELDNMLKPQINRLAKLLMRIGMMTVSFCYFNSKLVHMFAPLDERVSYEELMAECKHNAAAYLNMRDASLDAAFREFDENNL
ncbi:MAG: ribbon-helix-helix protein, CopG family [Acidobacteriota bacterium]|jgi:predicted transcriptional regulator|nr:ribbon-helix-helix protein, CopG family [Acidobacteriota bacterium]